MKKQYNLSITVGSMTDQFFRTVGHKRAAVVEAIVEQHLCEYGGYLSQEAAAAAHYRFKEKDTLLAEEFGLKTEGDSGRGKDAALRSGNGSAGTRKAPVRKTDATGRKPKSSKEALHKPDNRMSPEAGASQKPDDRISADTEASSEAQQDLPVIKNKERIMSGLSAFLG